MHPPVCRVQGAVRWRCRRQGSDWSPSCRLSLVALTLLASLLLGGRIARCAGAARRCPAAWRAYVGAFLAMAALRLVLAGVQHVSSGTTCSTDLRPFVGLVTGAGLAPGGRGAWASARPCRRSSCSAASCSGALAQSRLGFWGAALISSLLWTALHAGYSLVGLAEVFAIGLFLSWLLWRTGSLRVAIFCHALYNSLIVLALRFVDLPA